MLNPGRSCRNPRGAVWLGPGRLFGLHPISNVEVISGGIYFDSRASLEAVFNMNIAFVLSQ
jgi:hypothetical protein